MKFSFFLLLSFLCISAWGRSIVITQPLEGAVIPASTSNVIVKGTVDSVSGGAGVVVCNGKTATVSPGVNWLRGITLVDGGPNTITCTYTKDGQIAQSTVHFTWQGNVKPLANFTFALNGLTSTFNASSSTDPDGSITSYSWDFGDGTTGSGVNIAHTFSLPGTYYVDLTVTDNNGALKKTRKAVKAVSVINSLTITNPANSSEVDADLITITGNFPENANKISVIDAFGKEIFATLDSQNSKYYLDYVALKAGINNLTVKAYNQNNLLTQQVLTITKTDNSEGSSNVTSISGGILTINSAQSPLNGLVLTAPASSSSEDVTLSAHISENNSVQESISISPFGAAFEIYPWGVNFLVHASIKIPVNLNLLPSNVSINDVKVRSFSVRTGHFEEMTILSRESNAVTIALPHTSYSSVSTYYKKPLSQGELRITTNAPGTTIYVNGLRESKRGDISLSQVKSGDKTIKVYSEGYNEKFQEIEFDSVEGAEINFQLTKSGNNKPQINLANIVNGMEVLDNIMEITGNIVFNSPDLSNSLITLVLNNRDLMLEIDEAGNLKGFLSLLPGKNTIRIRATPENGDTAISEEYTIYNNEFKKTNKYMELSEAGLKPAKLMKMGNSKVGGLTISLNWDRPSDIDLHIYDPKGNWAYFAQKDGIPGGRIDVDDTTGVGPEVFTMLEPINGKYQVMVHYFGGSNTSAPVNATVNVHLGQVLLHSETFTLNLEQKKGFKFEVKNDLQILNVLTYEGTAQSKEEIRFTTRNGENGIAVLADAASYISDNQISWEVFDITNGTERNLNISSTGRSLTFNVDTPLPTISNFSQVSKPLKYKIVVKSNQFNLKDEFILLQDVESQIRQEYVDAARMTTGDYPSTIPIPLHSDIITHTQFLGVNFTFDEFNAQNDYSNAGLILMDRSLQMAEEARSRYGYPLRVSSAWRGPRRNFRVNLANGYANTVNSYHIRGSGIDLVYIESQLPPQILQTPAKSRYIAWKTYMYTQLCSGTDPLNSRWKVFSHGGDHIHLQPKDPGSALGRCSDLP